MTSYTEINEQNHKIAELGKVLLYMIKERPICDTGITCRLFFDFTQRVQEHLDLEERQLYKKLLTHNDINIKNTAKKFLSGSTEIKRIFKQYVKKWCRNNELRIKDHDSFVAESNEIFDMVLNRIVNETENFYPVVRKVYGKQLGAA